MNPILPSSSHSAALRPSTSETPREAERLLERNAGAGDDAKTEDVQELREAFDRFIGTTFYSQMLKSLRQTVGEPAYFHGGRAEEMFQSQLDQIVVDELAESSGSQLSGPMFDLFQLQRRRS